MSALKLLLDDFNEVDYNLIAIHSSLEDFRLAYFINQKLPIVLSKSKKNVEVISKYGEVAFIQFIFNDVTKDINWHLIQNKTEIVKFNKSTDQNLFLNNEMATVQKVFLLSEYKKVDYLLKIDAILNPEEIDLIVKKINTISNITTVYAINPNDIKSKNNLIF